jgi:hypothetical protein
MPACLKPGTGLTNYAGTMSCITHHPLIIDNTVQCRAALFLKEVFQLTGLF